MFTMPYDNRGSRKSITMEEEKKDTDSVASTHQTESVMSEATERDDQSSVGGEKFDSLLLPMATDDRKGRSRKSKRKTRRKRGESLERQICQLILGTVSNNTWDSQVEVENKAPSMADPASVEFILQDLDDPSSLELVQSTRVTAIMGRSFGTQAYMSTIDDKLRDSQWQDFGESDFVDHVTTGNGYSTNFDLQLATIAEAVSHRRLSRNLAREVDFDEYGDPSLEINFSDGMDNEDGSTEYENEQSQPDDELGSMSGLSVSEFNEGRFSHRDPGAGASFDTWGWQEPNGSSQAASENRSTSPSASTLQERQQSRTMAESDARDAQEYHGQASSRQRDASQVERNNMVRSAKSMEQRHPRQAPHKDAGIFKTKYEEWSPMMMVESPFEGIRFSDTLVDPDEFERIGSVDEEGFLITHPTRQIAKSSKVQYSASTGRNMIDPHFERDSLPVAPRGSVNVDGRKFVGASYGYSPDSVADYLDSGYYRLNRSMDPPGTRDVHLMDDWSESSTIRIAI